jgi:hypothetical protein
MNSEKIAYSHLELVMKYLEKHCKGNPIEVGISPDHKVIIKTTNSFGEYVEMIVFNEQSSYSPRIIKEDKLTV